MLHRLDDELIVAGEVEPGTAGPWVGQLDQRLIAHGVLKFRIEFRTMFICGRIN